MPFVVRWPGKAKPGSVADQTICFTDLLATFATITGYERKATEGPDSYDFSKVLLGKQAADTSVRPHLAMRSGSGHMTIRVGDWKLIDALGSGGFSKPSRIKPKEGEAPGQLYNLKEDLGETTNLYAKHPDKVKELQQVLAEVIGKP